MTNKNTSSNPIICEICGVEAARKIRRNKVFGKGSKMIVIENIPFVSCQNCGQTYITRDVMLAVDEIRTHSKTKTVAKELAYAKIA